MRKAIMKNRSGLSRRTFVKTALVGTVAASVDLGFPSIVPSTVFGATRQVTESTSAQSVTAASRVVMIYLGSCDTTKPESWRSAISIASAPKTRRVLVNDYYAKKTNTAPTKASRPTQTIESYFRTKISTVYLISTPDHWHSIIGIDAAEAGKDAYIQKPASLTIAEGRALSNTVHRTGRIFQSRQSATFDGSVSLCGRTRTQWSHRPVEDCVCWFASRSRR